MEQFQIKYKALVNVSDLGNYLGIILEVYEEKNPGDLTYDQTIISGDYDLIAGYHDKNGNLSTWGTYVRVIGPNTNNGLTLGEFGAGIAEISGEYNVISWEFDAVTADAKAGLSWDYVGANVGARLISGSIGAKTIPIPFTNKSIYIGAGGELFGIGFTTQYKDGKIKIKASAIIGGSLELGLVDRKE